MISFKTFINEKEYNLDDKISDENIEQWYFKTNEMIPKASKFIETLKKLLKDCTIKPSRSRKNKRFDIVQGRGGFGFVISVGYDKLTASQMKKGTEFQDYLVNDDEVELQRIKDKISSMGIITRKNRRTELIFYTKDMKKEWEEAYDNFYKKEDKKLKGLTNYINDEFGAKVASEGKLYSDRNYFILSSSSAPSQKDWYYDKVYNKSLENDNIKISGNTGTNKSFSNGYGAGSTTEYGMVHFTLDLSNYRGELPKVTRL
jgi:hypothetical protein